MVVWRDPINNTILRHKSNNYQPSSMPELITAVRTNKDRFSAIVYCRRIGTEEMLQEVLKSEVLVQSLTKHLRKKWKTQPRNHCKLYQEAGLEIRNLETVLRHQYNLKRLLRKGRGENLGKKQRKAWAKERKVQQTQSEEELLDNRVSLPPVLELHWGMCLLLPKTWLSYSLKTQTCYKFYFDYLKTLNKVTSCKYRIKIVKHGINMDIIPDFLRFCSPKKDVFFLNNCCTISN